MSYMGIVGKILKHPREYWLPGMYTHLFPGVQVTMMRPSLPLGYSYMSLIAEKKGLEVRETHPAVLEDSK